MRAHKEGNRRQQWYFIENPDGSGVYEIQNADDTSYCISSTVSAVSASKTAKNKHWKIPQVPGRPTVYLVNASSGVGDEDVLLYALDGGFDLGVKQDDGIEEIDRIMKNEEYRWRIIEVSPASLPEGDGEYRIRTLNGDAVHTSTVSGRKVVSIQNQSRGDQRAWEIINEGNGRCTIKNILDQMYLSAKKVGGKWIPAYAKTRHEENTTWRIKPTSDFTYSICIGLHLDPTKKTETQMSLSVDEKTIILKPMKAAHNQLWCMEVTDAPIIRPTSRTEADDDVESTQAYHGLNLEQDYLLRFGGTFGLYTSINMHNSTVTCNVESEASYITLEKTLQGHSDSDAIDVYISYTLNGLKKFLALKDSSLILDDNYYQWKIEEHPDLTGHFYICDGNQPQRILSGGPIKTKINATQSGKSDTNSLWEFISA